MFLLMIWCLLSHPDSGGHCYSVRSEATVFLTFQFLLCIFYLLFFTSVPLHILKLVRLGCQSVLGTIHFTGLSL